MIGSQLSQRDASGKHLWLREVIADQEIIVPEHLWREGLNVVIGHHSSKIRIEAIE